MAVAVTTKWKNHRRRVYQSVFQTDISQPTPYSTPSLRFPEQGQPFGGHLSLPQLERGLLHSHSASAAPPGAVRDASQAQTLRLGGGLYSPDVSAPSLSEPSVAPLFPVQNAAEDQIRYDQAWHVVTSRIALPSSATADDSFGTLDLESQFQSQELNASSEAEFYEAFRLVIDVRTALPRATHTEDIVMWHTQQVRRHFAQHLLPLLAACTDGQSDTEDAGEGPGGRRGNDYEKHMVVVMSSVRTLEAAMRLYSYPLQLIIRGLHWLSSTDERLGPADPQITASRFRRDVHALVSNSASPRLMGSLRFVLTRLIGAILGVPTAGPREDPARTPSALARPAPLTENDLNSLAARRRLFELIEPLYNVGLTGESFQVLFAEVMDSAMSDFVRRAYASVWTTASQQLGFARGKVGTPITGTLGTNSAPASPCIASLCDWVENHYARLAIEVLSRITADSQPFNHPPVTLADVKTYQSLALGRLAELRISELFDMVLAWPSSRGALDDLRVAIATPQRRLQLTNSFAAALERRLLHPGRSTLEILQTYIAIIRTFHALDHSKVLLGRVAPNLQLYLCGREDAVRIVVTGLLASQEEIRAAKMERASKEKGWKDGVVDGGASPFMTPALPRRGYGSRQAIPSVDAGDEPGIQDLSKEPPASSSAQNNKLVELAFLLTDPAQSRRAMGPEEDAELDWNDLSWVPDPVDAGANYKRPRSEDVIGTLISSLGSQDVFIREFQVIVAERLLSGQATFEQEVRVLNLLKKRFGDAALQNCDVMIRDIHESRKLDAAIRRGQGAEGAGPMQPAATPSNAKAKDKEGGEAAAVAADVAAAPYHARILSRLFWPNLDREHFLLPTSVAEQQRDYERGYEQLKSSRKLTWLNQLGQATVELELFDRTVKAECKTYEATVIYAFQEEEGKKKMEGAEDDGPAHRTVQDLVDRLQMDDDLILSALDFWVSKGVLRRSQGDGYLVAETLSPSRDDSPKAAPGSPVAETGAMPVTVPAKVAGGGKADARRQMYWQYVRGMLTNASATMPLAQMAMMLRMLVADGFHWGNEELQEFLGEKIAEGELEIVGGKYRLAKK